MPNGFLSRTSSGVSALLLRVVGGISVRPRVLTIGSNMTLADNGDGTATLAASAAATHTHVEADVTGLVADLAAAGGTPESLQLTVHNDTGGTLTKGTCVYDSNDGGDVHPTVDVLDSTLNYGRNILLGVLAEDIAAAASGLCTTFGVLGGLDTSGFSVGDALTCDNLGQFSTDWSTNYAGISVGPVITSHATTGSIFVLPKRDRVAIHAHDECIELIIEGDDTGVPIAVGATRDIEVPFNFTIQSATLLGDQVGEVVVDLRVSTFANYPPISSETICGATPPTIASTALMQDQAQATTDSTMAWGNAASWTVFAQSFVVGTSGLLDGVDVTVGIAAGSPVDDVEVSLRSDNPGFGGPSHVPDSPFAAQSYSGAGLGAGTLLSPRGWDVPVTRGDVWWIYVRRTTPVDAVNYYNVAINTNAASYSAGTMLTGNPVTPTWTDTATDAEFATWMFTYQSARDSTLVGWTTALLKGATLRAVVLSASVLTRVTLSLKGTR